MFPWETKPQEHYLFGAVTVRVMRRGRPVPDYTVGIADNAQLAACKG